MSDAAVPPPPPVVGAAVAEDKTVAIVAHFTLIGFIVAIIIHQNKKTKIGAFYLRQMLGLVLCGLLGIIPLLGLLVALFLMVLWVISLINVLKGEMKPVPLLGEQFQKWFGTAFE